MDVPHKDWDGLPALWDGVTVIGGNLSRPELIGCNRIDLLEDPLYLAENANITAHCAVKLALAQLPVILEGCPVLVIGWGRIGKCLARLLRQMGASVCVSARKETDRAMLSALGYHTDFSVFVPMVVFNTAPAPVAKAEDFPQDCLKIELASSPGILGEGIIDGRRLPGRYAPGSSGELIARSILRRLPGGD